MARSNRESIALVTAAGVIAFAVGCNAVLGLDEKQLAQAGADAGSDLESDATSDSPAAEPPSSCPIDESGYGDLTSPSCWTTFDVTKVDPGAGAVEGIAFDGRYMYFAPDPGTVVLRYDTTGRFADVASWSSFDLGTSLGLARSPELSGAVFDGRYITFVPNDRNPGVLVYDTTAGFDVASSWTFYDPTAANAKAKGFRGATFDGQYVYFVPNENAVVLRHDTRAAPGPSAWSTFDLNLVLPDGINSFAGGGFDGRFLYLTPDLDGVVVRYDVKASFTAPSSWSTFDTAAISTSGLSLFGSAFDGRFVYLGPGTSGDLAVRYDTKGPFSATASWTTFDLNELSPSFALTGPAAFDGRHLYYPSRGQVNFQEITLLGRYDTQAPFGRASSWSKFDLAKIGAAGVGASAFDGKYVYLAPEIATTIARFEARSTRMPVTLPAHHGSFY
jgi:hypothetical protein